MLSHVYKTVIQVVTLLLSATPLILKVLNEPPFQGTTTAVVVSAALALVGTLLHYNVPNTTTDPAVAATQSVKLVDGVQPRAGVKHHVPRPQD